MSVIECKITREEEFNTNKSINELLAENGFKFYGPTSLGKITEEYDFCMYATHYKQVIKDGR